MGTLKQKLDYINETKRLIGESITAKGGTVPATFREYPTAIDNLPSGKFEVHGKETVTANGNYTYFPPEGQVFSGIDVDVNVPTGGGSCAASVCFDGGHYAANEDFLVKMRKDLEYTEQKYNEWDPTRTDARALYHNDKKLVYAPKIDTSKVTDMYSVFYGCSQLTSIPQLDTSKVTNMYNMFDYCSSLTTIPLLDTSNVTNMQGMFDHCSSLTSIPQLDTSKVTNMNNMFSSCSALTTIPLLDTSKVTDMNNMFYGCKQLTSIPPLDTSNVTDTNYMFNSCNSLTTIPPLNTSVATNMSGMFGSGMGHVVKVSEISVKSATSAGQLFSAYSNSTVQYLLVKDLGTPESVTYYDFKYQTRWGREDKVTDYPATPDDFPLEELKGAAQTVVDSLLTYSFDRKAAGYADCTLKVNANIMGRLTEEQKGQIAAKGFILQA